MLVNTRSATARRIEKGNLVFMIRSIDPAFRFSQEILSHSCQYEMPVPARGPGSAIPATAKR
jgi:hypothetical protein